jgi:nucleotide-binding universal stress UspA family protein
MKKHFLVTVSNDYEHLTGVEFICSFFKKLSEHQITLLHICRRDASDMNKALMDLWTDPDEKVNGILTVGARKALDKATDLLSQSKMTIDQMMTITCAERYGKVKDILKHSSQGLYDAIILGKRASYALQWIFERPADETAQSIIRDSLLSSPLWICPEPEKGRKNVLVCVDGSEESLRAVDHVGYILSRQDQHSITLFYVENGAGLDADAIFEQSIGILRNHSISNERISRESTWALNAAGTILNYAENGGFASIAVGLHGQTQELLKRMNLVGRTTATLINKTEKVSLWCCP